MGRLIAAYRSHPDHGMPISQEIVGLWSTKSQGQICKIETGRAEENLDALRYWARLLGIPQHLLWFVNTAPGEFVDYGPGPAPKTTTPITSSPAGDGFTPPGTRGAAVSTFRGEAAVDAGSDASGLVTETWLIHLNNLTRLANTISWAALRPLVAQQIRSLDTFCQRRPDLSTALASADARWSEFMSWICANGGFPGTEVWLERAHRRATEARDPIVEAYVVMRRSQHAVDGSDASTAVSLSRQALDSGDLIPPKTKALCLTRLSEGLALAGSDESLELLTSAQSLARTEIQAPGDEMAGHCDSRYVNAVRARCLYLLGERKEADARLVDILDDDQPAGIIDIGMWTAYHAESRMGDRPEQSAVTGLHALDIADSTGSARIVKALAPVAVTLRASRGDTAVDTFLARYRASAANEVSTSTLWS
jgi:hypothetical protein